MKPEKTDHKPLLFGHREAAFRLTTPDDAMMRQINKFTLEPLTRDQVAAFTMDLCNDQIDTYYSRFPEKELRKIMRMVVGRPLMELHDLRGRLPRGTFFRAEMVKNGDVTSVRPDVYILRTPSNEEFIAHIVGGVYRDTSIGFSFDWAECSICNSDLHECSHWPGMDYNGQRCHYVMHGVDKVYEGSVVPAGAQGTQFVSAREDAERGESVMDSLCKSRGVDAPPKSAMKTVVLDKSDADVENEHASEIEVKESRPVTRDDILAIRAC